MLYKLLSLRHLWKEALNTLSLQLFFPPVARQKFSLLATAYDCLFIERGKRGMRA